MGVVVGCNGGGERCNGNGGVGYYEGGCGGDDGV